MLSVKQEGKKSRFRVVGKTVDLKPQPPSLRADTPQQAAWLVSKRSSRSYTVLNGDWYLQFVNKNRELSQMFVASLENIFSRTLMKIVF